MSRDPAFLFYPGDWLGGTMCFTLEEKGAYLELLILQFNQGKFTEAQAKHMLSKCEASVWQNIKHKFINKGGYYYQERLQSEIEKRRNFSQSRKNNALGSNKPKTYAEHMEDENENINENKKETKIEKIIPPKIENVIKHFEEKGSSKDNANRFFNYYESNGWKVGKNKMVNWHSAVANWLKNNYYKPEKQTQTDYSNVGHKI